MDTAAATTTTSTATNLVTERTDGNNTGSTGRNNFYTNNPFDPDLAFTRDDAASTYIDILSDDDAVTASFLPQPLISSSSNNNISSNATNGSAGCSRDVQWTCTSRYSLYGTIFNFINCIVGAGAIGLGGAMSASGGIISCIVIIAVAILVKYSLDLIIDLSINLPVAATTHQNTSSIGGNSMSLSYEDLGYAAYGTTGKLLVMTSKFVYAFGCVVAYTIIVHDNFSPAIRHLFHVHDTHHSGSSFFPVRWLHWIVQHDVWCTWLICTCVILPLCLLRDMSTLASTSFISIIAMVSIVGIVIYMWYVGIGHAETHPLVINVHDADNETLGVVDYVRMWYHHYHPKINGAVNRHWFIIRWYGLLNNMGTFVFSFVCHHTVHLTYRSLVPELRNLSTWKYVSTISLCVSGMISLCVAVFCYMTFWNRTVSDIFQIYPDSYLIDMAKLLLCITMLLTFPLPFFTCRELLILLLFHNGSDNLDNRTSSLTAFNASDPRQEERDLFEDLNEPLLDAVEENNNHNNYDAPQGILNVVSNGTEHTENGDSHMVPISLANPQSQISSTYSNVSAVVSEMWNSALLPNDERQLKLVYHIVITFKLWFVVTAMALAAPNLGDVLDFVGCCSGTLIAFVLPGLFAIRLQGWTYIATITLLAGGVIGIIGTICSLQKLFKDTFA